MTRLAIVVPCYNEQDVIRETARRLLALLASLKASGRIEASSALYFVDDGSSDRTWDEIQQLSDTDASVHGIKLSRNCGHQNALLAGLLRVPGDAVISIDADLQDDPEAMREMLSEFEGGADIVYGVRRRRDADTWLKRASAEGYYRLLERLGVKIVFNHADYRLLSRRAIEGLASYGERNVFLRGLIPQLGFKGAHVYYDRAPRLAGETKYPLKKMLGLAMEGVTSFSVVPIRAITLLGFMVSLCSFAGGAWTLWERLVNGVGIPGWASTLVPMFFLGGVQLLSLGMIGEYIAKIYLESKHRPRYIIDSEV